MAKFDMAGGKQIVNGLSVVTLTGTTPANSNLVDTQGFEAVTFCAATGTVTVAGTAGVTFKLQESDSTLGSAFTDVAAGDVVGSITAISADTNDNIVLGSIGYIGGKRYVRLVATGTTNTNAVVYALAIKERAEIQPPAATAVNIAAT